MSFHTHFRFHPRLTQIGFYWHGTRHAECYLVQGDRLVLIDTGCAGTPEKFIAPALAAMGFTLQDISLIINTHGHYDHIGGNAAIVAASGAEVWLPDGDVDIAHDFDLQFSEYFADRDLLVERRDRLAQSYAELQQLYCPTQANRILNDNEMLDLGNSVQLRVIASPGHSRGSTCYYWENEGILIAGDSVVGLGSRPGALPLIFFPEPYEQSLRRLSALDIRVLCQGHHYVSPSVLGESVKYGDTIKTFFAESLEVFNRMRECAELSRYRYRNASFLMVLQEVLKQIQKWHEVETDAETGLPQFLGGAGVLRAFVEQANGNDQ